MFNKFFMSVTMEDNGMDIKPTDLLGKNFESSHTQVIKVEKEVRCLNIAETPGKDTASEF